MKRAPLTAIIVGAGYFGTKRLEACLSLPGQFRVLGVADPDAGARGRIDTLFRLPTAPDIRALKRKADLAIIATPNAFHPETAITAMGLGMHVLCEKPLATTSAGARQIVRAAAKYKRLVKTGSNHRFFHTVEKAKELADEGVIGNILNFKGSIGTNGSRVSRLWFWNREWSGGGTFIDNGCHLLDIARMFMGDFSRVTASMATNLWKTAGVEDMGTAIYETKDGRIATITSSWYQWAGYLHIELWGERGYIIVDSTTHDTVTVGGKNGMVTTYDFSNEQKDSYHRELTYFAECIRNGVRPRPDDADGAAVISMIEAAYAAAAGRTWKPVRR